MNRCPNCGYDPLTKQTRGLMEVDPDAPGPIGLLRGDGHPFARALVWAAVAIAAFGVFHLAGIG